MDFTWKFSDFIKSIHFSVMKFGLKGKMYKMTSTVLISLIILAHIFAMDSYIDKQRKILLLLFLIT